MAVSQSSCACSEAPYSIALRTQSSVQTIVTFSDRATEELLSEGQKAVFVSGSRDPASSARSGPSLKAGEKIREIGPVKFQGERVSLIRVPSPEQK